MKFKRAYDLKTITLDLKLENITAPTNIKKCKLKTTKRFKAAFADS